MANPTEPKVTPEGIEPSGYETLNRRIRMLDLALSEAAQEKFPEGSWSDAQKRIKAKERWIHNAYKEAEERDKYAG